MTVTKLRSKASSVRAAAHLGLLGPVPLWNGPFFKVSWTNRRHTPKQMREVLSETRMREIFASGSLSGM
jgi:hypothetical protein